MLCNVVGNLICKFDCFLPWDPGPMPLLYICRDCLRVASYSIIIPAYAFVCACTILVLLSCRRKSFSWASAAACRVKNRIQVASMSSNPLLQDWTEFNEFGLPPFAKIKAEHFEPALELAMQEHLRDLQEIIDDNKSGTSDLVFEKVCGALDRSGALYEKVTSLFSNLCSSLCTEDLQEVQKKMAGPMARHSLTTSTFPGLFELVDAVHASRASLAPEEKRLVERQYLDLVRAGARFSEEDKKVYADIAAQLAEKMTQFEQNVMADEMQHVMIKKEDMSGCPAPLVAAAKEAAKQAGKLGDDEYVITLSRSLAEPFLTYSDRRDLRQQVWEKWTKRGELDQDRNNKELAEDILKLRQKQAQMHRKTSFGEYQCEDMMAKTPERVMELLESVWEKASVSAEKEREALLEYVNANEMRNGAGVVVESIEPWDWRYYAEKVRQDKFNFDESTLKPYLSLDAVTQAAFEVSQKLYGLKYVLRDDLEGYHEDVKVYEVMETTEDGTDRLVAIFLHDNYARQYKRSGAWMSEFRGQHKNFGPGEKTINGIPIIANNNNFAKGSPTLLSFDDATTLFHELGHGHHGMLSDVKFKALAGTRVLTDFVELPSQLMEHWLRQPEVLKKLKHYETQEPVTKDLLDKLMAARNFNQGFATIEYTACALIDMAMHMQDSYENFDIKQFEAAELKKAPDASRNHHETPPHSLPASIRISALRSGLLRVFMGRSARCRCI